MKKWIPIVAIGILAISVVGCSDDENCPTVPEETPPPPALAYVGSQTCGTADCHETTYNTFIESGHPYKLTEVPGHSGPVYPWDSAHADGAIVSVDGPPPGTTWSQFAYVIGGYGWKARFVKPDGLIYTAGPEAQLNLWADGPEWVAYHQDEDKPYNYSCFRCHTTGASPDGSWPEGESGWGTFAFGGVQCEECHGQGSQHASDPELFEMAVNPTSELCGRCHTRDAANRVEVSGGYIRHHEQYDEIIHSPHETIGCGSCHDPHASTVYDDLASGNGVIAECISCHPGYDDNNAHVDVGSASPTCTDCHMPEAGKSARVTDNPYVADIASHTFTINPAAVDKSAMWTTDGKFLAQDEFGRGRITLDFACYSCHEDTTGVGGGGSEKSLEQLSAKATNIHAGVAKGIASK